MYPKSKGVTVPSDSVGKEKLALYVYEYLVHNGAQNAAQTFLHEIEWDKTISLGEPPGFLHQWWSVFWDLYCAAPERRENFEHSNEGKAFHDYGFVNAGNFPNGMMQNPGGPSPLPMPSQEPGMPPGSGGMPPYFPPPHSSTPVSQPMHMPPNSMDIRPGMPMGPRMPPGGGPYGPPRCSAPNPNAPMRYPGPSGPISGPSGPMSQNPNWPPMYSSGSPHNPNFSGPGTPGAMPPQENNGGQFPMRPVFPNEGMIMPGGGPPCEHPLNNGGPPEFPPLDPSSKRSPEMMSLYSGPNQHSVGPQLLPPSSSAGFPGNMRPGSGPGMMPIDEYNDWKNGIDN